MTSETGEASVEQSAVRRAATSGLGAHLSLAPLAALGPGLGVAIVVALAARAVSRALPHAISEALVAVLLGLLVGNFFTLPLAAVAGVRFSVHRVLRLGIILLGARLSLIDVAAIGVQAFGLVVACMALAFTFTTLAGRSMRLPPRLALLIGVGTAVCGNSAIVATAPVVEAEEREMGLAIATITLFGTLAVFAYPLVGRVLGLSDTVFGLWSGVAVNDTSQVVAASAAYSPLARDVATVVKLVRNTLMAPLIVLIAWWWRRRRSAVASDAVRAGALKAFPVFVLGFLAMALARTTGVIDRPSAAWIDEAGKLAILVALAGVGLSVRLREMRSVGPRPFYVGFGAAALLAAVSLILIRVLGLAP